MVVAQLGFDPMWFLLRFGELSHVPFCVLFGLNKFFDLFEGEPVLEALPLLFLLRVVWRSFGAAVP